MAEQSVVITSTHRLHSRPASMFKQAVTRAGLAVTITKSGKSVNAASILGVISLGIEHNDEVIIAAEGENADDVVAELAQFLSTNFDEQ